MNLNSVPSTGDRTTYAAGISNLLGEWEKSVNMKKYLGNWEFGIFGM